MHVSVVIYRDKLWQNNNNVTSIIITTIKIHLYTYYKIYNWFLISQMIPHIWLTYNIAK